MPERADDLREQRLAAVTLLAIVVFRSGVFVFWPQAHFDADSAITGLMAAHLADGRAFPLFYYGQSYMLGVEAYLAAPLFAVFGPSVTALKLPLLAINVAVALMLHRAFVRDVRLPPWLAIVPVLFFALPAPGTAARITEANGGNLGPFLYIVLIWTLRNRPAWCGAALGVGFLHREFTIYGVLALLAIELLRRDLFSRRRARDWGVVLVAAIAIWSSAQLLKPFSSAAGPETTIADVYQARDNVSELLGRICLDVPATSSGIPKLATEHFPVLFGTQRLALVDFGIESTSWQGMDWSWILLLGIAVTSLAAVGGRLLSDRGWRAEYDACLYFTLVGLLSVAGYLVGRCGEVGFYWMRYDLLSLLGAAGIVAWGIAAGTAGLRLTTGAMVLAVASLSAVPHARLWHEYLTRPPVGGKQLIIRELDARGIRYAYADYWYAYAITFLTDERITAASNSFMRVPIYNRIVDAHRAEAIRISRDPCEGGEEVLRRIYFCKP